MANWAIVIGIDQYWKPNACLKGAVRDALKICDWLVSLDGGAVPERNLALLLERASDSPDASRPSKPANRSSVVEAIEHLLLSSRGQGDRFFFYFAGHGVTARMDFSNESAIVLGDFSDILTDNSLTLRSITELFQGTQFRQQFFFIDACRNIPWNSEYRLGEYPKPRVPVPPTSPQFIMYATSPGTKALELQQIGDEGGVFTEALMQALKGKGIAKVWNSETEEYVVHWNSVFRYVEEEITRKKLRVGNDLIQIPRQAGERGSQNPELGRFFEDAFTQETLDIHLQPDTAVSQAQIAVGDLSGEVARTTDITQLPVQFSLSPRTYSVRVAANDFRSERRLYPVDLYRPITLEIQMEPAPGAVPPAADSAIIERGLTHELAPGTIHVQTSDTLAKVELLDNTRNVITTQEGELTHSGLSPGFYRARMITPEGVEEEQLVELLPNETHDVWLKAPPPSQSNLFQQILSKSGIAVDLDNNVFPSEAVGPLASAQVPTLLALAAGAAAENAGHGYKLRQIGLDSFQQMAGAETGSGVQIVLAVDADQSMDIHSYLTQTKLRCWSQFQAMPQDSSQLSLLQTPAGVAQFAWDAEPGAYWLSIQMPDQRPVTLAVTVPVQHLALVVFYQNALEEISIYHYLLAAGAHFPTLRRSEAVQRSYINGRIEEPLQNMTELLHGTWMEPVAACLAGYMLLKLDPRHNYWPATLDTLAEHAGALSDSHIIRAEYLDQQDQRAEAAAAFSEALAGGLPVTNEGLVRLAQAIERHQLDHPRVEFVKQAYANRVPSLTWTAVPVTAESAPVFDVSGVMTNNQSGGVNIGAGAQAQAENIVGGNQNIENREAGRDYYEAENMYFGTRPSDSDDNSSEDD